MSDAGGDRAAFEAEIPEKPIGDIAIRLAVTLDHRHEAETMALEQNWPVLGGFDSDFFMDQRDAGQRGLDRVNGASLGWQRWRQLELSRPFPRGVSALRVLVALRNLLIEGRRDPAM